MTEENESRWTFDEYKAKILTPSPLEARMTAISETAQVRHMEINNFLWLYKWGDRTSNYLSLFKMSCKKSNNVMDLALKP